MADGPWHAAALVVPLTAFARDAAVAEPLGSHGAAYHVLDRTAQWIATGFEGAGVATIMLVALAATIRFARRAAAAPDWAATLPAYRADLGRGCCSGSRCRQPRRARNSRADPDLPERLAQRRDRGPLALAPKRERAGHRGAAPAMNARPVPPQPRTSARCLRSMFSEGDAQRRCDVAPARYVRVGGPSRLSDDSVDRAPRATRRPRGCFAWIQQSLRKSTHIWQ